MTSIEEVEEKEKISDGFSDLDTGQNGFGSNLKLERNTNYKRNKENLELLSIYYLFIFIYLLD